MADLVIGADGVRPVTREWVARFPHDFGWIHQFDALQSARSVKPPAGIALVG